MPICYQREEAGDSEEGDSDLLRALVREELVLHYQPVVDLKSGKMVGAEALLRWDHPTRGLLRPKEFLAIAEKEGAIFAIEEWILHAVCKQNKQWQKAGVPPFVVSVNLSSFPAIQEDLLRSVESALQESGLDPKYLELEITEELAMDAERTIEMLFQLKRIGVGISIDDFGRGYSSLNSLKRFPIDKLKIDHTFIKHCMEDATEKSVVQTIIGMAKNLRLAVVAEGVEAPEQLVFLQQNLCDAAQGHLISIPLDPDVLTQQFASVQRVVPQLGLPKEQVEQLWKQEGLFEARVELGEAIRNQQGMTFKFAKQEERYVHTLCDGELLYRMGLTPDQVIGSELSQFMPEEAAKIKTTYYERAWDGEENVCYEGFVNGIHYLAALRPIYQAGKVKEVIASCVDITELKKTEEALRNSEAKYRLITENMSDIIVVVNHKGIITYTSPAIFPVLGVKPEELQDQPLMSFIDSQEKEKVERVLRELMETKRPQQVSFTDVLRNGTKVILEAKGTPVLDSQGEVEQVIFILRNITAQVQAEEFLRKMDKLAAIGHLAAGVAHEIRNPVTSIKGFVQLLKQDQGKQEYFDIMLAEFQQLENILREFVSLTQQRPGYFEFVDIRSIIHEVLDSMQEKVVRHTLRLNVAASSELKLWCDPGQIRQLFIHLLSNAVEAMPDGGTVWIEVLQEGEDEVKIRIVDEGCGMSEQRLKRLGEPFYSTKEKGTGLGLMISYKIIQYHHGYVHFSSEPHKGTTVEVVFPINNKVRSST